MEKFFTEETGNSLKGNAQFTQEGNTQSEASRPCCLDDERYIFRQRAKETTACFYGDEAMPFLASQPITGTSQSCGLGGSFNYGNVPTMLYPESRCPDVYYISQPQRLFFSPTPAQLTQNPNLASEGVIMANTDHFPQEDQEPVEASPFDPPLSAFPVITSTRQTYHILSAANILRARNTARPARPRPKCTICSKTFSTSGSLKVHMRIHSGERPFRCQFCHKAFAQSGNLADHARIHTGEKPYRCPVCDRRFTQSSAQKSHLLTHMSKLCRISVSIRDQQQSN